MRRGNAGIDDVALIEFKLHFAGNGLLRAVHKGGQCLAQRGVPLSKINQLCKFQSQFAVCSAGYLIQADGLPKPVVRMIENGSARSFVYATGFHPNQPVLYNIQQARSRFRRRACSGPCTNVYAIDLFAV